MKNTLYAAYGSNLCVEQMRSRCPGAKRIGTGVIKDATLRFRGSHDAALATIEPSAGASVPVLLWELTEADEAALDRYEGWPVLYRKATVRVEVEKSGEGSYVHAMAYIMNDARAPGRPSGYYYSLIREGYQDAGFDLGYLKAATLLPSAAVEGRLKSS